MRRGGTIAARWGPAVASGIMAAPAIVLYTVLLVVPIGVAAYLSLTDWDGYSPNPALIGLANYARLVEDPEVLRAAGVTLLVAAAGTVALNGLGLGLAVLVNGASRFNSFLRLAFFYPHVISVLAVGFLWSAILGANGAVNALLTGRGWSALPFLSDPEWAMGSMIAVLVWAGFGVNLVLYLAGLQAVSPDLVESARIDGATRWQIFHNVTLPALRPVVTLNVVLSLVMLLKTYDLVVSLTGGGPAGSTQTAAYLILWDSFHSNELGFGSAQAVVLMLLTAGLALSVIGIRNRTDLAAYR
jgi:ABC-type sugar transport system permease subunit